MLIRDHWNEGFIFLTRNTEYFIRAKEEEYNVKVATPIL